MLLIQLDRNTNAVVTTPDGHKLRIVLNDIDRNTFRAVIAFDGPRQPFKVSREDRKPTDTRTKR